MKNWRVKLSLFINYFVFAILLNSVGTVILQVQNNFGVSESAASVLEPFKDFSILIASFLIASYVIRIGYKKTMLLALGLVAVACFIMPSLPSFAMTKMLFAVTGVSFALIKVTVYATIGLISSDTQEHASFMNFIESFFMIGVLAGYFLFSAFVDDSNLQSTNWFNVYYLLSGLCVLAFLLLFSTSLDESSLTKTESSGLVADFVNMFRLLAKPMIIVFIISAFLYVLIEQGIMSWLPTFNSKILNLPTSLSIQMASILAASVALGRFLAGFIMKKFHWFRVLAICLIAAAGLVLVSLPLANGISAESATSWFDAPLAAFIFPLIGLFLAPIYPAINSVVLSSLPKEKHGSMSGLIVLFSALGGAIGSLITGYVFEHYDGQVAFYLSLIPISIIFISLFFLMKFEKQQV